jgi:hypothetical protein
MTNNIIFYVKDFASNEFVQFMMLAMIPFIAIGIFVPRMLENDLKKDK